MANSPNINLDSYSIVDNLIGIITAFADGGGGTVTVTSNGHGLSNSDIVTISNTTNYNGQFTVANIAANTFKITVAWNGDDATGIWDKKLKSNMEL